MSISIIYLLETVYGSDLILKIHERFEKERPNWVISDFIPTLSNWNNLEDYPMSWIESLGVFDWNSDDLFNSVEETFSML
jgi:hypothetical protein